MFQVSQLDGKVLCRASARQNVSPLCSLRLIGYVKRAFTSAHLNQNGYFLTSQRPAIRKGTFPVCAAVDILVPSCPVEFGQCLKIVGSEPELGAWNAADAAALNWGDGDNWSAAIELPAGKSVEFKVIKASGEEAIAWEDGPNRCIVVPDDAAKIVCVWGSGETTLEVEKKTQRQPAAASKELSSAAGVAQETVKRVNSKRENLEAKLSGLEEKVENDMRKLESIREVQSAAENGEAAAASLASAAVAAMVEASFDEEDPLPSPATTTSSAASSEDSKEDESGAEEPQIVAGPVTAAVEEKEEDVEEAAEIAGDAALSNRVDLPPEMAQLASSVRQGSDGELIVRFGDTADGMDAATLAAKLLK